MHIITSTDPWDLSTRQIEIGLIVSATNTQSSDTGSATIAINGNTVATGVSVTYKATSDTTLLDFWGSDRSKLALTTVYANISKNDMPITVTVTAANDSADLLWCHTHSNSIPFIFPANLTYAPRGNTRPLGTPDYLATANANIVTGGATVDMTMGGWKSVQSGSNVSVNITGILGNIS